MNDHIVQVCDQEMESPKRKVIERRVIATLRIASDLE